jgi:hypothetical protein
MSTGVVRAMRASMEISSVDYTRDHFSASSGVCVRLFGRTRSKSSDHCHLGNFFPHGIDQANDCIPGCEWNSRRKRCTTLPCLDVR